MSRICGGDAICSDEASHKGPGSKGGWQGGIPASYEKGFTPPPPTSYHPLPPLSGPLQTMLQGFSIHEAVLYLVLAVLFLAASYTIESRSAGRQTRC
jgi:hypothetical protein